VNNGICCCGQCPLFLLGASVVTPAMNLPSMDMIVLRMSMLCTSLQVMLSLLLDIKNNRQRGGGGGAIALTAGTTKWLKSVGAPAMALTSLSWDKLLAPSKKVPSRRHDTDQSCQSAD